MINRTERRVVRLTLKPQLRILVLIQMEPVDYFAGILAAQGSLMGVLEWKHTTRFYLSLSQSLLLVGKIGIHIWKLLYNIDVIQLVVYLQPGQQSDVVST